MAREVLTDAEDVSTEFEDMSMDSIQSLMVEARIALPELPLRVAHVTFEPPVDQR